MATPELAVLVIDDQPDNLITVKALLREDFPHLRVCTATSGGEGIALALAEDPITILLDILMPGMDGFEVCRRLKADPRTHDIPVVFLSALRADQANLTRALEVGAEAFLTKPIGKIELRAQVRAMTKIRTAILRERDEARRLAVLVTERTRELEQSKISLAAINESLREENDARKRTEEILRQRTEELGGVLDAMPAIVLIALDTECRVVTGNRAASELIGAKHTMNLSQHDTDPPDPPLQFKENGEPYAPDDLPLQRAIATGLPVHDAVIEFRFPDGRRAKLLGHASPLFSPDGRPRGAVSVFLDITSRAETEAKMAEQLEELRRWQDVILNREDRVQELKREVNEICGRAGEPLRYENHLPPGAPNG